MTTSCEKCSKVIPANSVFCNHCGQKQSMTITSAYRNPRGTWHVTTEGDCESRSVRDLGTYSGYVDDIARALASKAEYSLRFKAVRPELKLVPDQKVKRVSVSFDIDSATWNMPAKELAEVVRTIFADRPVVIEPGTYYASFNIVFP